MKYVTASATTYRQIIHKESHVGISKAISAQIRMMEINSSISCKGINARLNHDNAIDIISQYDLVVDSTDNYEARYIINDACVLANIPFVSGAAVGMEGHISLIIPKLRFVAFVKIVFIK